MVEEKKQDKKTQKWNIFNLIWRKILERTRQRPRVLSEEEIEELMKPSQKKEILRWTIFSMGVFLFILSILFFYYSVSIDWFIVTLEYEGQDIEINVSFILGMILMAISMWWISRLQLNKNLLRENTTYIPHLSKRREPLSHQVPNMDPRDYRDFVKIRSFPSTRLIAAMLMLTMALINMSKFGVFLTEESQIGNWLVLGGPSLFYPMSFLPLIISICLIVYSIGSSAIITFTKSPHFYFIEEHHFLAPWMTEIPRSEIIGVRLTNSYSGPKYTWILVLGPHIIYCFINGIHFLYNPYAFGMGFVVGRFYLITAAVQVVVLFMLLLKTQTLLEIVTKEKRYELFFSPPAAMPNVRGMIEEFFELPYLNTKNQKFQRFVEDEEEEDITREDLQETLIKDWTNIIIGMFFFTVALISRVYYVYAGDALRVVLWLFSVFLVIKGFKEDFSSPRNKFTIRYYPTRKSLIWRKEWMWYNSIYRVNNCKKEEFAIKPRVEQLGFFEVLFSLWTAFVLGMDLMSVLYFVPTTDSDLIRMRAVHIIMDFLILLLVFWAILRPHNTLIISKDDLYFEYPIPGTLTVEQARAYGTSKKVVKRLKIARDAIVKQKGATLTRFLVLLILFALGLFFAYVNAVA